MEKSRCLLVITNLYKLISSIIFISKKRIKESNIQKKLCITSISLLQLSYTLLSSYEMLSMSDYVGVYTCISKENYIEYTHTCMCEYAHICVFVCMHLCVCVCVSLGAGIKTQNPLFYAYNHTCVACVHVHVHTCVYFACICMHACVCICLF